MRLLIQPNKEDAIESEMVLEGRDVETSLETYESADTKYNLRFIVAKNLPPSEPGWFFFIYFQYAFSKLPITPILRTAFRYTKRTYVQKDLCQNQFL